MWPARYIPMSSIRSLKVRTNCLVGMVVVVCFVPRSKFSGRLASFVVEYPNALISAIQSSAPNLTYDESDCV